MTRVRLRESRRGNRCALCHGELVVVEMACRSCGTALHSDCAATLARCPTLACDVVPEPVVSERGRVGRLARRAGGLLVRWGVVDAFVACEFVLIGVLASGAAYVALGVMYLASSGGDEPGVRWKAPTLRPEIVEAHHDPLNRQE